jgi:ureidoacrylate peracid hydrolase
MELKELVNPKKTSLLIIDIQNDYCSKEGKIANFRKFDMSPIDKTVNKLGPFISSARKAGVQIIWTQMVEDHRFVPKNIRLKMESRGKALDLCSPNSWGFDFYRLKPAKTDNIITKYHYDAFTNAKLKKLIGKRKNVIVTGVYTSRCVDSTARRASAEGYNVIMPTDLVAMPRQLYARHKNSILDFDTIFGFAVKSKDIENVWNVKGKPF